MKRYEPTAEDIAMLRSTNAGKIRNRNIIRKIQAIGDFTSLAFGSFGEFIRRWFRDNWLEISIGLSMFAAFCYALVLWADVLPDPVM